MNPTTYYGGTRVRDGIVRPLKATNFEELVRRYFDSPVPIALDRAEFLALPKSQRDVIKDVPYVTPCSFKEGETKRCDANADKILLICIDLDPPDLDFDEADYVSDFFHAPETIAIALEPYSFVAYCTANHTPERPRLRIVIPVKPCDIKHRYKLVAYIAKRLGLPADFKGVRESSVASQPAYRPVIFKDEDNSTPRLLAARTSGTELDASKIIDIEAELIEETFAATGLEDCGLENLPAFGLTVEDVRSALFLIDPDCGYKQWTEIASALRHQFRSESEAREAFDLFDEWSATGTKYKGQKDTKSKWRSFRPDPTGKKPITISSLFHYAKLAGWKPEKATEDLGQKLLDWIDAQDDTKVLEREGLARIAAFPLKDAITESRLVEALRDKLKSMGAAITAATANKALKQAKSKARFESDRKELPGWLRPWIFVSTLGEFVNHVSAVHLTPANFNLTYARKLMSQEPDNEMAKIGLPPVQPQNFALNIHEIETVEKIMYDPRPDTLRIFDYKGVRYLNSYRPDTLPAEDPANSEKAFQVFRKVVANVAGNENLMILDFIAHVVQFPGTKIRWCPCIQSAQGAGKGTISEMVAAVIGADNVMSIEPKHFKGGWNDWAEGKQFISLDEIFMAGESRSATMDILKTFVSDTVLSINQKNKDARKILNFANVIAYTNHHDALYLEESDRRYAVVRSPIQTKQDVDRLNASGIFEEAREVINELGGALRHALLNYPISPGFNPNAAPRTSARDEMVEASKNRLQIAIEELIEGENPLIGDDIILASEVIRLTETEARNNHRPAHFLAMLGYERYDGGKRFTVNGNRSTIWIHRDRYDSGFGRAEEILELRAEKRMDDL